MKTIVIAVCALSLALFSGCTSNSPKPAQPSSASCNGRPTHDWKAWNNLMPGSEKSVHVTGLVSVNTGGWKAELVKKVPQGINPAILLLDLRLTPPSGPATQVMLELPVEYVEKGATFKQAQVFCGTKVIADVAVKDVH